jgi:hypothetical protein
MWRAFLQFMPFYPARERHKPTETLKNPADQPSLSPGAARHPRQRNQDAIEERSEVNGAIQMGAACDGLSSSFLDSFSTMSGYARARKQGNRRTAEQIESARRTQLAKCGVGFKEQKPVPALKEFCVSIRAGKNANSGKRGK